MTNTHGSVDPARRLNELLVEAGQPELPADLAARFATYLSLLLKWNARVNLTAIRDQKGILARHFIESIICARSLPAEVKTLLDFGSGAGFPGIPVALCRPEIAVTLAESQGKKAAFLREAVRTLELNAAVFADRAERIQTPFDAVVMRSVDRMDQAVAAAADLVAPGGCLVLLSTGKELPHLRDVARGSFQWTDPISLPFSQDRLIASALRARLG